MTGFRKKSDSGQPEICGRHMQRPLLSPVLVSFAPSCSHVYKLLISCLVWTNTSNMSLLINTEM